VDSKDTRDMAKMDDIEQTIEMLPEVVESPFPDFEIKGEIGRGGFGVVKLARENSARRDVALKTTDPGKGKTDPKRLGRFMEEAYITAQLQHPGIVPVYRIDQGDGGRPF